MTSDLTRALTQALGDEEFVTVMERFARTFPQYRTRLPLIPYAYTRTRLAKTPRYEVVVMQWAAGSVSPIHDHGFSRCWVLMLDGSLEVENFERDGDGDNPVQFHATGDICLRAGDIDHRYGPLELHRVRNAASESAISLQLYAEPLTLYTIVDAHTRHGRLVTSSCDLELRL